MSDRSNARTVYSSSAGRVCPTCGWPANDCKCSSSFARDEAVPAKLTAKLRMEKKGRGGKTVTVVYGLPRNAAFLKELAQELKRVCGTGGAPDAWELLRRGRPSEAPTIIKIYGGNLEERMTTSRYLNAVLTLHRRRAGLHCPESFRRAGVRSDTGNAGGHHRRRHAAKRDASGQRSRRRSDRPESLRSRPATVNFTDTLRP